MKRRIGRVELGAYVAAAVFFAGALRVARGASAGGASDIALAILLQVVVSLMLVGVLVRLGRSIEARLDAAERASERLAATLAATLANLQGPGQPVTLGAPATRPAADHDHRSDEADDHGVERTSDQDSDIQRRERERGRARLVLSGIATTVAALVGVSMIALIAWLPTGQDASPSSPTIDAGTAGVTSNVRTSTVPPPPTAPPIPYIARNVFRTSVIAPAVLKSCHMSKDEISALCGDRQGDELVFEQLSELGIGPQGVTGPFGDCARSPEQDVVTARYHTPLGTVRLACSVGLYAPLKGPPGVYPSYDFTWLYESFPYVQAELIVNNVSSWSAAYAVWRTDLSVLEPPVHYRAPALPVCPLPFRHGLLCYAVS